MTMFWIVAKQVITMAIFLAIGFLFFKKKLVTVEGVQSISNVAVRFAIPCSMIKSYMVDFSMDVLVRLLNSFMVCGLAAVLSILLAKLLCRSQSAVDEFCASFSNVGAMGIPLVQAALGEGAVFDLSAFLIWCNVLQWTYGYYVVSGRKKKLATRQILRNPMVVSTTVALAVFFLPFHLPDLLVNAIQSGSNILMPLTMIVLGAYLARTSLREILTNVTLYRTSLTRLLVIPFVVTLLMMLLPKSYHSFAMAAVIATAAPVATNCPIVAEWAGENPIRSALLVYQSTLLSILTLPLVASFASFLLNRP